MPRHKRQDSDCDIQAPWIDVVNTTSTDHPIFSPISATVSSPVLTRTGKANEQQRTAVSRDNSLGIGGATLPPAPGSDDGPSTSEAIMRFRGARVKVKLTPTHISWKPVNPVGCCMSRLSVTKRVPYDEVLSAVALSKPAVCCCPRAQTLVVYSFSRRSPDDPNTWRPEEYLLCAASLDVAKEWVALINARVQAIRDRPRSLLVFINPYAGARLARLTWERHALPVFLRARIQVNAVETTKQDHAREMIELMKAEELAGYQGVVAVGGDGLFQEVVSGLLARRARGDSTAYRIRVGHVPAGSTDAVAYTLHGSRCATTAALHIALGDRVCLDSGRVTGADGSSRHFVCQAGYGFMGDVMRFSEMLRFMGPGRYDVTGALQYLRLASYRVALSYREAPSTTADVQQLCTAQCEVCRMAGIRVQHMLPYQQSASSMSGANLAAASGGGSIGLVAAGGGGGGSFTRLPVSTCAAGGGCSGTTTVEATPAMPGTPASVPGGGGSASGGLISWFLPAAASGPADGSAAGVGGGGGGGGSSALFGTSSPQLSVHLPPPLVTGSAPALHEMAGEAASEGTAAGTAAPLAGGGAGVGTPTESAAAAAGGGGAVSGCTAGPATPSREWTHVEGEFVSIMCVVTPCRSDKSRRGIIPNGHLADGRMYLVLVSKCSHVAFLRFLIRLATRGLVDRCLPFVRVIPVTGLRLSPLPGGHRLGGCLWDPSARESAWNVDGELLADNTVDISVQRGALEVFARGPETDSAAAAATAAAAGHGGRSGQRQRQR